MKLLLLSSRNFSSGHQINECVCGGVMNHEYKNTSENRISQSNRTQMGCVETTQVWRQKI